MNPENHESLKKALQESEERLRLVMEGSNDDFWDWDIVTGRVSHSPRWAEMLGYSLDEIEQNFQFWERLVDPDDFKIANQILTEHLEGRSEFYVSEYRIQAKNGEWKWILDRGKVVSRDASGKPLRAAGTHTDITQRKLAEIQQAENEIHNRGLAEIQQFLIVRINPAGQLTFVNDGYCTKFGKPRAELIGTPFNPPVHPDDLERSRQTLKCLETHPYRITLEQRNLTPEGWRWLAWEEHAIKDNQGRTIEIQAVARDITERKQAEEELRQSNANYQLISESTDDMIWVWDVETQKFTYVSPSVQKLRGYTPDEMLRQSLSDVLTPESTEKAMALLSRNLPLVREGKTVPSFTLELDHIHKNGSIVPTEATLSNAYSDKGKIQVIGISRNITGRRQAEKAILESEELFRTSFEYATAGVCLVDSGGRFLRVNQKLCDILGFTCKELAQLTFNDVTHPEDRDLGSSVMKKLISGEVDSTSFEKRYIHKDGHILWVSISTAAVRSLKGDVQYFVTYIQDITERKQMVDKLRQHSRAVESSPASIIITDVNGNIEYVNPKFTLVTGYTSEEVLGKNPRLIQSGRTPRAEYQKLWATILAGEEWHGEFQNKKKNGELFYESVSISPIIEPDGKITHFIAVKEDITDKRRIEEQLLAQRDLAQSLAAAASLEIALPICLEIAIKISQMDSGGFYIVDPVSGDLVLACAWGVSISFIESNKRVPAGSDRIKLAMTGQPVYAPFQEINLPRTRADSSEALRAVALIPILYQGRLIGCFNLASHVKDDVPVASRQVLEMIASQVGIVIARIQAEEGWRNSQRELQALFNSMQDFLIITDAQGRILEVNQLVLQRLEYSREELVGKDISMVHPVEPSAESANLFAEIFAGQRDSHTLPLQTKKGALIPAETKFTHGRWGSRDAIFGICRDVTARKLVESELLSANNALTARLEELKRRNNDIVQISEASALLQVCVNAEEAYLVIERHLKLMFPDLSGVFYLTKPSLNLVESRLHWGWDAFEEKEFPLEDCYALRRSRPHLSLAANGDLSCPHLDSPQPEASLCTPVAAQGENLGMLHMQGRRDEFPPNRLLLIQTVVDTIALALVNLQLRETLQIQSIRDPITELYNRRFMEESLYRELARATRTQTPLGIIMLDIDDFKSFNDTYGHQAGDFVLSELGKLLQRVFRKGDIVCRYGGEEFTIILPGAALEQTIPRAEKLQQEVQDMPMVFTGQDLGKITISQGVSVFPADGHFMDQLIRAADAALYTAKKEGRNRICVASGSPAPE